MAAGILTCTARTSPAAEFVDPSSADESLRPCCPISCIFGIVRMQRRPCGGPSSRPSVTAAMRPCPTGRIGVENLPKFLADPRRYKPSTAMNFPGLRSRKDIHDVIAYTIGSY